jgi:rubrerythrin
VPISQKPRKKIAREKKFLGKACLDDVVAIESGMELENKSINFFTDHLKQAVTTIERDFLNYIIAEERSHYIILSDLRFYYVDPEHWLMEKGRTSLDGAGGIS